MCSITHVYHELTYMNSQIFHHCSTHCNYKERKYIGTKYFLAVAHTAFGEEESETAASSGPIGRHLIDLLLHENCKIVMAKIAS